MSKKTKALGLGSLKGVGPKRKVVLEEAGIYTLEDLLYYFPRRYDRFQSAATDSEWEDGVIIESFGFIKQIQQYRPRRGQNILKVLVEAADQNISLFWFNQPYLRNRFEIGEELHFIGKLSKKGTAWSISHPKLSLVDSYNNEKENGLVPVYPLVQKLSPHWFTGLIQQALKLDIIAEIFPISFCKGKNWSERAKALGEIHTPSSTESLEKARYRFAYEELLFLQTALLERRHRLSEEYPVGLKHKKSGKMIREIFSTLPFDLTEGQNNAWLEIEKDMEDTRPMQRLLQGDVGSGKTVIATLSLVKTVESGFQGAFMVPTEILAQQHFETLNHFFKGLGITVALLTQNVAKKEKDAILAGLRDGTISVVIGTHSLIQETVLFYSLGLVITDEQHRFGVNQRKMLQQKGNFPDMLVMTATPIPRTLALTLYGDLDISTITTMPEGRKVIRTFVRGEASRGKVYQFALDQIKKGKQVYVVAPAIEENIEFPMKSVEALYKELHTTFKDQIRIGVLHGQMKSKEKIQVIEEFHKGEIDLLISTTVIEVGVHVANATVMIIESAERFGLSQLHQLRGRVGRGIAESFCILISSSVGNSRLQAMERISDGFFLAEEDLKLRGPGEFFGEKQHGLPELRITDLFMNVEILKETRDFAFEILENPKKWEKFITEMHKRFSHWLLKTNQH